MSLVCLWVNRFSSTGSAFQRLSLSFNHVMLTFREPFLRTLPYLRKGIVFRVRTEHGPTCPDYTSGALQDIVHPESACPLPRSEALSHCAVVPCSRLMLVVFHWHAIE